MTEMQRYFLSDDGALREYESGPYVRFTDAEAAISAARADMLAKCIAAVEALPTSWLGPSPIAALRSLQDQP